MNLSDLKDGMVVKLRNGEMCVVLDGYIRGKYTCFQKAFLREDLTHLNSRSYDVMSVHEQCFKDYLISDIFNERLTLIWERKEETKPKLSEDEKVILRNLGKDYKYIVRDENGNLSVFKNKPIKTEAVWYYHKDYIETPYFCWLPYDHLFQMVQWDDEYPTLIDELLKEKTDE